MGYTHPVTGDMTKPDIPESALEHRVVFETHWIDKWTIPNPFVALVLKAIEGADISLEDFSFRQDSKNVGETALIVAVNRLRTTLIVGLNEVTFRVNNPDWDMAPQIVETFDSVVETIASFASVAIKKQESILAFHVTPGNLEFASMTAKLVNASRLGEAEFYGLNLMKSDSSLMIEASRKFKGGAFFRLTRVFSGAAKFAEVALALHADESFALGLIGVEGLM
jgi:hypothetical protein